MQQPENPSPNRRISPALMVILIIPLFGLAVAVGMLVAESSRPQLPAQSAADVVPVPSIVDQPAPDFALPTLDGGSVRISDLKGRVVFVNFWATWCPPCVDELPLLQKFAAEQGDDGAVILAVNSSEDAETIRAYLDANAIDLSAVPVLLDSDAAVYRRFGVIRLPTTWIIDREGVLRTVKFGAFDEATLLEYLESVS